MSQLATALIISTLAEDNESCPKVPAGLLDRRAAILMDAPRRTIVAFEVDQAAWTVMRLA